MSLFPDLPTGETTVEGEVDRIIFAKEETAFTVLSLSTSAGSVTVVGDLTGARQGETIRVTGLKVVDRRFGPQIKARTFVPLPPNTKEGVEKFLATRKIPGIGTGTARKIVDHFGESTFEVLDKAPERLAEVPGIGQKKRKKIIESWAVDRDERDSIVFLQTHGVSPSLANRIWRQYGTRTARVVRESPYRLAVEVSGVGFLTADEIAKQVGIPRDSLERAQAGLLYVLGQLTDEGHVFAPADELLRRASKVLSIGKDILDQAMEALATDGRLIVEDSPGFPTYLFSMHEAEVSSARRLREILSHPLDTSRRRDAQEVISAFESTHGITLASQQRQAVELAITEKALVITGGPGTGKTTIIRAILGVLPEAEVALLAAPTGRAAKRMNEATGESSRTLHRLLEFDPKARRFIRDATNPLEGDILIIDETSMLDVTLLSHLLDAVPNAMRLVFVGDIDQLPSVGPGAVLSDLIHCGALPVVRLDEVFRQANQSLIIENAHRIRKGQFPAKRENADFFFFEREDPEEILQTVENLVAVRIPRGFGLDPVEEIQVITPMNRGMLGTQSLNTRLQARLNPDGPTLQRGERLYRQGDKVMQTKNNYNLDVWNGDLGRILTVDAKETKLGVEIDGRLVPYDAESIDELTPAYACSIHKSQGSEFPAAVIPLHGQHFLLLKRNLIYTAVTRARKLAIIVGSRSALERAVRTEDSSKRWTRLKERLREA